MQYLLTGKVRWAEDADGSSRVQVSPSWCRSADGAALAAGSSRSTRR